MASEDVRIFITLFLALASQCTPANLVVSMLIHLQKHKEEHYNEMFLIFLGVPANTHYPVTGGEL